MMTGTTIGLPGGALRRAIRRSSERSRDTERCELCRVELPGQHRHLLDEQRDVLVCACQACTLLFQRPGAGQGHYRLVPDRRVRLPELAELSPRELGIPVGLAFFVARPDGGVLARYPSPIGATQWNLQPGAWQRACRHYPVLRDLQPGVEALLVRSGRGADERWIVPIDDCYRLVALVRREWKGLSGGSRVWPAIEEFFAELGRRPGSPLRPAPH